MFAALFLASTLSAPGCWQLFDDALRHQAEGRHPAYVAYDERIAISDDNRPIVSSRAHVEYRDDGLSRVSDARFDNLPYVTRHPDPGPPELGPYGAARLSWLPPEASGYHTIADVRAHGALACENQGEVVYKGYDTYHLVLHRTGPDRPQVKEVWVDAKTGDIWKLIVSGYVLFGGMTDTQPPLADFEVELGYVGPYLLVHHVVWKYRLHEYSQYEDLFGEYYLTGYSFPASVPNFEFAESAPGK